MTGQKGSLSLINVLTWAGVRGGLSLAMALSIPDGPHKQAILAGTFGVVIFSMLVQSMTMEGLAIRTGYGTPPSRIGRRPSASPARSGSRGIRASRPPRATSAARTPS